jgi:hypothetical protein
VHRAEQTGLPTTTVLYSVSMTPVRKVAAFRLDDDLLAAMQTVWERDGVQPSEQVRRALRAWLESKGVKVKAAPRRAVTRQRA